jgi:hypothetical protein
MATPIKFISYTKEGDKKPTQYPIRLGYIALVKFKQATGKTFEKSMASEDADIELFEELFWAGLQAGCDVTKTVLDLKREDAPFVLDEVFMDFIAMIPEFFPNAAGNLMPGLSK